MFVKKALSFKLVYTLKGALAILDHWNRQLN